MFNFGVVGRVPGSDQLDCRAVTGEDCEQRAFGAGWLAVAHHGTDDSGSGFANLVLQNVDLRADAHFFPAGDPTASPALTDAELLAMAQSPTLLDLVRLGVDYAATRPATGTYVRGGEYAKVPRPQWPVH
jgi:hypothetical protein